jgi:hypothetical protein
MLITPANPSPSALLSRQRIAVDTEGELVKLAIGNAEIRMPYETAIQLSTWLRVRGKQAKRAAGDTSRHWSVIGLLDGGKA